MHDCLGSLLWLIVFSYSNYHMHVPLIDDDNTICKISLSWLIVFSYSDYHMHVPLIDDDNTICKICKLT